MDGRSLADEKWRKSAQCESDRPSSIDGGVVVPKWRMRRGEKKNSREIRSNGPSRRRVARP